MEDVNISACSVLHLHKTIPAIVPTEPTLVKLQHFL